MRPDGEKQHQSGTNVAPRPDPKRPASRVGDAGGADPLRRLLTLANEELDKEAGKRDLRLALGYLEQYRHDVVDSDRPRLVFDTIRIAREIERASPAPASVQREARQFIDSTPMYLGKWPEVAREYEQKLLEDQLQGIEARRGSPFAKLVPAIGLVVFVAGVVSIALTTVGNASDGFLTAGIIASAAGVTLAGLAAVWKRARDERLAAEAENVRRKLNLRSVASPGAGITTATTPGVQTLTPTPTGEYFGNLVRINVDNLGDYYTQVRVHTNNSFWASIVAGGLGFILIASGLILGFSSSDSEAISFVAMGSGVLVEFISGVFFYLYNRTVRQLKDYHDSLLDVQNILLSFRIVDQAAANQREALFDKILTFLLKQRGQREPPAP
jgi:TRADD-N domain-containing protein